MGKPCRLLIILVKLEKMKSKSFTLLELLVVITIIGILSSIVVVSMSGSADTAEIAKGKSYAQQLYALLGHEAVLNLNFNENAYDSCPDEKDLCDLSGYKNNGIIYNNEAVFVPSGIDGYALSFDGSNDRVDLSGNLKLTNDTALSLWMKLEEDIGAGSHSYYPGIFSAGSGGSYNDFITFAYDSGNRIKYEDASGATFSSGAFSYSTGDWIFIVITMDDDRKPTFFINGEQKENTGGPSNYLSLNYLARGYAGASYDGAFKGLIDEVKVYSTALPLSEIKKQYAHGLKKLLAKGVMEKEECRLKIIKLFYL